MYVFNLIKGEKEKGEIRATLNGHPDWLSCLEDDCYLEEIESALGEEATRAVVKCFSLALEMNPYSTDASSLGFYLYQVVVVEGLSLLLKEICTLPENLYWPALDYAMNAICTSQKTYKGPLYGWIQAIDSQPEMGRISMMARALEEKFNQVEPVLFSDAVHAGTMSLVLSLLQEEAGMDEKDMNVSLGLYYPKKDTVAFEMGEKLGLMDLLGLDASEASALCQKETLSIGQYTDLLYFISFRMVKKATLCKEERKFGFQIFLSLLEEKEATPIEKREESNELIKSLSFIFSLAGKKIRYSSLKGSSTQSKLASLVKATTSEVTYRGMKDKDIYGLIQNLDIHSLVPVRQVFMDSSFVSKKGDLEGSLLAYNDANVLTVGTTTGCCMRPGEPGLSSSIYSLVSSNAALFAIKNNKGKIVAQSFVWQNPASPEAVVLDSVEWLNYNESYNEIYEAFVKSLTDQGKKVLLGVDMDGKEKWKKIFPRFLLIKKATPKALLASLKGTYTDAYNHCIIAGEKNKDIAKLVSLEAKAYPAELQAMQDISTEADLAGHCEGTPSYLLWDTGYVLATETELVDLCDINGKIGPRETFRVLRWLKDHFEDRWFTLDARSTTSYPLIKALQRRGRVEVQHERIEFRDGGHVFIDMAIRFTR